MILADTSGLLALYNSREPRHADVSSALLGMPGPIIVSPYVVAELDYLVSTRIGVSAEVAVLREIAGPEYELAEITAGQFLAAIDTIERYADQRIGITDASIVVLAQHYRCDQVLTLDRRHIDMLRTLDGARLHVHP